MFITVQIIVVLIKQGVWYCVQEYQAVSIVKHPRFNPSRLDNNLAIITVDKVIDLTNPTVNTACLPSCDDQFDFR